MSPGQIATNEAMKLLDKDKEENILNKEGLDEYILDLMQDDFQSMGYSRNSVLLSTEKEMPPEGYYKVALKLTSIGGFHFLRQVSDRNGAWAHKPGTGFVSFVDDTPKAIYSPSSGHFPAYFCTYYYVIKSYSYYE